MPKFPFKNSIDVFFVAFLFIIGHFKQDLANVLAHTKRDSTSQLQLKEEEINDLKNTIEEINTTLSAIREENAGHIKNKVICLSNFYTFN